MPRKKRTRPQSEYGRCGVEDVRLRWSPRRSAKPICDWIKDASETVQELTTGHQAVVDKLCADILALPPEELEAANDYFMCWQRWDWMPINQRPNTLSTMRQADKFGSPKFEFSPACYRKVRGLDQTKFRRWVKLVWSAQGKIPQLVELLGFRAKAPKKSKPRGARTMKEWDEILRAREAEKRKRMEGILNGTGDTH